ncbi:oxidoreductase [bacterium]|nr:oxidoreductase [bacterium]
MALPKIPLTQNGPHFSQIIQGFWRLADWKYTKEETARFIQDCYELGITTYDHADIYGLYTCEDLFGEAFQECSVKREEIELVTKCGIKLVAENRPTHIAKGYDTRKEHILLSAENSLKALRTDYIDVLLIHRPDPLMHAEEVAEAFTELKKAGKVLHFGVSNFLPCQFNLLEAKLPFPIVTNQIEYSVMDMEHQDNGVIDLCQQRNIRPMAWSPLGGGDLFTAEEEQPARLRKILKEIGNELGGVTIDQVALAFILKHPVGFLPVLGTGKIERVKAALQALNIELTHDQWFMIWEASKGHEVP